LDGRHRAAAGSRGRDGCSTIIARLRRARPSALPRVIEQVMAGDFQAANGISAGRLDRRSIGDGDHRARSPGIGATRAHAAREFRRASLFARRWSRDGELSVTVAAGVVLRVIEGHSFRLSRSRNGQRRWDAGAMPSRT
jgi:hypothetical protein